MSALVREFYWSFVSVGMLVLCCLALLTGYERVAQALMAVTGLVTLVDLVVFLARRES